jgi:7-carboxy-7-deazaguanine synthase
MKVRYSEIFTSFQGEAAFAGTPCVWIRLFGCPLECNGFGQKDPTNPDTYVLPYENFDLSTITKIEDLPVFDHGCDSSYSWSKRYKHLVHDAQPEEIVVMFEEQLLKLGVTNKNWEHPVTRQPIMLCFTGGEPMQWQRQMAAIMESLCEAGHSVHLINIETNTLMKYNPIFMNSVRRAGKFGGCKLHFSMSPKLYTVSGEKDAITLSNLQEYAAQADSSCLKVVHNGSVIAWEELEGYTQDFMSLRAAGTEFWLMPVGATKEQQEAPVIADIAMEAMKRGWKVATRNHAYVFGNRIGT